MATEALACYEGAGFKAGEGPVKNPDAHFTEPTWDTATGVGIGTLTLRGACIPEGECKFPYVDLQDKLPCMEGSPPLFPADSEVPEHRQCLRLHVGLSFSASPEEALLLERQLRGELWRRRLKLTVTISEAEAFVRHNAHDCLAAHHEKDYRV